MEKYINEIKANYVKPFATIARDTHPFIMTCEVTETVVNKQHLKNLYVNESLKYNEFLY